MRGLSFSCVPVGGGGSTVPGELRARASRVGSLTVCFVDSDRHHESGPLGETARRCLRELPNDLWYARLRILGVREIENLIPTDWIRASGGDQIAASADALQRLDDISASFFRSFADIKNGASSCDLMNSQNQNVRQFAIGDLRKLASTDSNIGTCHRAASCDSGTPCFSIPALGVGLLERVASWLSETASASATKNLMKHATLHPMAKSVFEWGVSLPKMRA